VLKWIGLARVEYSQNRRHPLTATRLKDRLFEISYPILNVPSRLGHYAENLQRKVR
jgi:hypothetical protein